MKKTVKILCAVFCVILIGQFISILIQKQQLHQQLIRIHIVANSDTEQDQSLKLMVRDAITSYLQPKMNLFSNKEEAEEFLKDHLDTISGIAVNELVSCGYNYPVKVSLQDEAFPTRKYDTFTLPAGVYEALRVEIGNGAGKNWWCVAFPTLCIPATSQDFVSTAVSEGLDPSLSSTLAGSDGYNLRFFLLERIGMLENFLHRGKS